LIDFTEHKMSVDTIFSFNEDQFNQLFPFYILINQDFSVQSCGNSLKKLLEHDPQGSFDRCFRLKRPAGIEPNFFSISATCKQLVVIEVNSPFNDILRGQFELLQSSNQLLFIGSPWFDNMTDVKQRHLTLHDFAFHDPLIDLLHVLKTKDIVNDDLRQLLTTLHRKKSELRKATDEIEEIALFALQNPDPLFRIATDGHILMSNPAADQIACFTFEGKTYCREEFWKHVLKLQTFFDMPFEAGYDNKIYSFIGRYVADHDYINVYGRDVTEKEEVKHDNQHKSMVLAKVAFDQTHLMRAPLANILGLINLLEMNKTEGEIDPLILPLLLESAKKLDTVINEIVNLI